MITELLNELQTFCETELERRRWGFVDSEIADATRALGNVSALRRRIVEKELPPEDFWSAIAEATPEVLELYAAERPGKSLPPKDGEPYILLTAPGAIFVAIERGPTALQCYFRNESAFRGTFWDSVLIRQAMEHVWNICPEKGLFTIVRTARRGKYSGLNFRMAGWGVVAMGPRDFCKLGAYRSWFGDRL